VELIRSDFLTGWQQFLLVLFRFSVGWHLFYQGMGKMRVAHWSSGDYLRTATGPLGPWFQKLSQESWWLGMADQATVWGLVILGLLLMVGLFTRTASLAAILLLLLFYLAHPPFPLHGFAPITPQGFELYVNQVLIEILALSVGLAFNTGKISGLDLLIHNWIRGRRSERHTRAQVAAELRKPHDEIVERWQ
jgi:thiosulfate dehydrogenase (quinone) large subunit